MKLVQLKPLQNRSDFSPSFFYDLDTELDLYRIASGFHGALICNGCGMPTGNAYTSGHIVPSLLRDWLMLNFFRPAFPTYRDIPTVHLEYLSLLSRLAYNVHINVYIITGHIPRVSNLDMHQGPDNHAIGDLPSLFLTDIRSSKLLYSTNHWLFKY